MKNRSVLCTFVTASLLPFVKMQCLKNENEVGIENTNFLINLLSSTNIYILTC